MSTESRYNFASRDDRKAVETGPDFAPKFDSDGLIPAIAQDADSGEILLNLSLDRNKSGLFKIGME